MNGRLDHLLREIRQLEAIIQKELEMREKRLRYTISHRKVVFEREIAELHRTLSIPSIRYILSASLPTLLTVPVVYAMVVPALLLDLTLWVYQGFCFRIYGIPKVRRADHVILDRHYLKYLNAIERLNCDFCSYFNGLISFAAEIGARTEQYWCPIKHARGTTRNSRSHLFVDYGEAHAYSSRLEAIRKQFDDLA